MPLRESKWIFQGCSGGGLSLGVIAASKGQLNFLNPSGKKVSFKYLGAGLGVGAGLKSLKQSLPNVSGSIAPSAYWSDGRLYMLPGFHGNELTEDDLSGMCEFIDLGVSLGSGVSGTVFHLGYDAKLVGNYKASLFVGSQNTGLGAGASYYIGSLELSTLLEPTGAWEVRANGEVFYYRFKAPNRVQWSYERQFLHIEDEGNWQMKTHLMRVDWPKSGSYEEWNLPLSSNGQSGIWYTSGAKKIEGMDFQGIQGTNYQITAQRLADVDRKSSGLCAGESMATCD